MLEALRCQSLGRRKTGGPIAHTNDERNTDINAALLRKEADPTNLLKVQSAGLLDQERSAAEDQPFSQSGHRGMTTEHQGEVELLSQKIFVRVVELTIQL